MPKKTSSPVPTIKVASSIADRLRELHAARAAIMRRILAVEAAGGTILPADPSSREIETRARQLLAGNDAVAIELHPGGELRDLYKERDAHDRAIQIGDQQLIAERVSRQRDQYEKRADEWRELQYQRAQAISVLRSLNRRCADFRRELSGPLGPPSLPADMPPQGLLGDGTVVGDEGYRFLRLLVSAGIITEGEIEKWTSL